MTKSLPIDYKPEPTPYTLEDIPRYLEREFQRIAEALAEQPVALTVAETSIVTVTTIVSWQRLFSDSIVPSWEVPGGSWTSPPGQWVCPTQGLYQVIADLRVEPYGAGNKIYYAGVRVVIVHADGSPDTVVEAIDSGADDFMLGITLPVQVPLLQGDVVYFEATVVHDQFIGDTEIDSSAQLFRVSA